MERVGDVEAGETGATPRRHVPLGDVLNFRDLGGYRTDGGGWTRRGAVYRSDSLHKLTAADEDAFAELGIRAVYDLRGLAEREARPSVAGSHHLPVTSRGADLAQAARLRTRDEAEHWLFDDYLVMLSRAAGDFGALFSRLADPVARPAVFHCAGGKDRTGMAAALLLGWLGVDRETVLDDFELTSKLVPVSGLGQVVESFCEIGMTPEAAEGLLSTPRWAMEAALVELDATYGGVGPYLRDRAGLSDATLDELCEQLVVLP